MRAYRNWKNAEKNVQCTVCIFDDEINILTSTICVR